MDSAYFENTMYLIRKRHTIFEKSKQRLPEWYLSEAGAQAYQKATTPAQRTQFFYSYYLSIARKFKMKEAPREILAKLAFVTMNLTSFSLPYAQYPKILQEEHNPLVSSLYHTFSLHADNFDGIVLTLYHYLIDMPLGTQCNPDDPNWETYRLQRLIIGVFPELRKYNLMKYYPSKVLSEKPEIKALDDVLKEKGVDWE